MPVIQKIEISNFLNAERGSANLWYPRWPHQVFDLGGLNSAMNIPNGKGKSAMVMAILALLTGDRKALKEVSGFSFAPQRQNQNHFTHIRIQVLVSTADSGGIDLLSLAGGEPGGDPMVFGVYGNSGENGELKFYSYQGRLEDCPVAHTNGVTHTFVSNNAFREQLDGAPKVFPANRQESSDRAWQDHVQTIFDMATLHQQLKYQKLRGGEGGHGYFDVHNPAGTEYSASVFYERLAPELLVEGMGELGEEDEHGIEDTIHTKASRLIVQKHKSEQQGKMLVLAGNTLAELEKLVGLRGDLKVAANGYDEHRKALSVEFAALKYVLIDEPIPGVPRIPDESNLLARAMVLQDGKWFLPDRVMAEFTGEPASEVNRRAEERNSLMLEKMDRSQVIDFACHIKSRDTRGKPNQLYSRETALALLGLTTNFTREWTKQKAVDSLNRAFDWVEAHADTNPGREMRKGLTQALAGKEIERKGLSEKFEAHGREWSALVQQQSQISDEQSAHREMLNSGLFTDAELADPEATGAAVIEAYQASAQAVDVHKERVMRLRDVHAAWETFHHEHPDTTPATLADQIGVALELAKAAANDAKTALVTARDDRKKAQSRLDVAKPALQKASMRLERFQQTAPAAARFVEVFGDVSPTGLAQRVRDEANAVRNRVGTIGSERGKLSGALEALHGFRRLHGDTDPAAWLAAREEKWEEIGRKIGEREAELVEARTRRTGLDKEVIVAGKVTREAASVAGGNHCSLHAAIAGMKLDPILRENVLTLFSALLHTPVYKTVEEAREAAVRLEAAGIEAPVFLHGELETFCQTGEISMNAAFAHTWLVGIRTRQVECLLDPSLVEREKVKLDAEIQCLHEEIKTAEEERLQCSPHVTEANSARKAAEALTGGYEAEDARLTVELADLEVRLPDLDHKSSPEMVGVIQYAEKHQKEFAGITEAFLRTEFDAVQSEASLASDEAKAIEARIDEGEKVLDAKLSSLSDANTDAMQIGNLRKLQTYLDAPDNNPAFMRTAAETLTQLEAGKSKAEARTHFRFALAAAFLRQGSNYAQDIENRIKDLSQERTHIQDKLLPALNTEIEVLRVSINDAAVQERKIDRLAYEITRMYRTYAEWSSELLPVSRESILETSLGAQTIGIHEAQSASERADLLAQMADELDFEKDTDSRRAMNDAKSAYEQLKTRFDSAIEIALAKPDMDMSEYMRAELERAKLTPDIVEQLHLIQQTNFDKSAAANKIAQDHLEAEWAKIGEWLTNFTKRLKKNFDLMKKVFGPKIDEETKAILNSGFQIEGKVAEDADIKAVLDSVVETIEKAENDRANRTLTVGEEKKQKTELRTRIRNEFYRSVVTGVRIKVCMPSISKHPLVLERKMVSTGQGIAMALLWIVKMAEFTTKRWQNEQASSSAQRKRLRHTQFTIIDGAFSSLSDEGLIKDAMDSIEATKGSFQLIITDHDPDYRNNFDYFPTLIVAKEYDGKFMMADKKTRDLIDPASLGMREGALGVMNLRAVPKLVAEA